MKQFDDLQFDNDISLDWYDTLTGKLKDEIIEDYENSFEGLKHFPKRARMPLHNFREENRKFKNNYMKKPRKIICKRCGSDFCIEYCEEGVWYTECKNCECKERK